jgi:hypothetical protein
MNTNKIDVSTVCEMFEKLNADMSRCKGKLMK